MSGLQPPSLGFERSESCRQEIEHGEPEDKKRGAEEQSEIQSGKKNHDPERSKYQQIEYGAEHPVESDSRLARRTSHTM